RPRAVARKRCIRSIARSSRRCQRRARERAMRGRWFVLALLAGSMVAGVRGSAQTLNGGLAGAGLIPGLAANSPVQVLPVRGNIYVLMGAGANITLSAGLDGVLMVDSGSGEMNDQVLAAIRAVGQFIEAKTAATA